MLYTILLTGATDGIGLATAEKLASQGHHLCLHGRNPDKLKALEAKLNTLGKGQISTYQADLANFQDTQALANALTQQHSQLDIIINNAGIYKSNTPITKDKLDIRIVVNTLAPYLLTQQLLPLMHETGRVINVASAGQAPVDLNALAGHHTFNDEFNAYAQSKLAIIMWSRHLALTLKHKSEDKSPAIIAVNPGSLLASKMVKEGFGIAGNDINIGADILVRLATHEEFANASGLYFDNDIGQLANAHPDSLDPQKCSELVAAIDALLTRLNIQPMI